VAASCHQELTEIEAKRPLGDLRNAVKDREKVEGYILDNMARNLRANRRRLCGHRFPRDGTRYTNSIRITCRIAYYCLFGDVRRVFQRHAAERKTLMASAVYPSRLRSDEASKQEAASISALLIRKERGAGFAHAS
jgi:hypothetical protein